MRVKYLFLLFLVLCMGLYAETTESIYVRFKMVEPKNTRYFVKLGGYVHIPNWYIPVAYIPGNALQNPEFWVKADDYTSWFDLKKHAGNLLHGRLNRSGGVAEFPNITADFITEKPYEFRSVIIEIATRPDEKSIVKRFQESYRGSLTSFLVSKNIEKDAEFLETAGQMTERHLLWARQATGGKRNSPEKLIIQTSFWAPQREELNLKEGEVLWLLGFNTVGNQMKEVKEKFNFRVPGHMWANFGPDVSKDDAETQVQKTYSNYVRSGIKLEPGTIFNFSDEVTCPEIKNNPVALRNFHDYLKTQKIKPEFFGVKKIEDVVPIESPRQLKERQEQDGKFANRIFYYTCRFRQISTNQKFKWLTEAVHKYFGNVYTSTLVADHPYFAGTGLGMGMGPNPAWGSTPLACDWFAMAREKVVDIAGIEDWMGLQYMYGPNWTWEGFQLMGFQASIFRSGSDGTMPVIAWITPSDEINLRLKTSSALCQGAKHFFYWTYGPTATSTENYWSDLKGEYDGIAKMTRQLSIAENIIAEGKLRPTKVALLYSISSDLWQPYGYIHMLERRMTYFALVHQHYLVDMITEEDVIAGKLKKYSVLYVTDPCIHEKAIEEIKNWVRNGGYIRGTCGAGTKNQFNEDIPGLAEVFGIKPHPDVMIQQGKWHVRGALNDINYIDIISSVRGNPVYTSNLGAIGVKVTFKPTTAKVFATFTNGTPAGVINIYGRGKAEFIGSCPGIAYAKEAKFVFNELKEKWKDENRQWVLGEIIKKAEKLVEISQPVVEAGIYDADKGSALVLANFTYKPINDLNVEMNIGKKVKHVFSCEKGNLNFVLTPDRNGYKIKFSLPLDINDIVLVNF